MRKIKADSTTILRSLDLWGAFDSKITKETLSLWGTVKPSEVIDRYKGYTGDESLRFQVKVNQSKE